LKTSIFELFKIGIGPSSSHTVGPMRAAREFALTLDSDVLSIRAELYGSLALTGKGHGTDRAILLGLAGESPETVDPAKVAEAGAIPTEIIFHKDMVMPGHPNTMRFTAYLSGGSCRSVIYYSIGGGFILREGQAPDDNARPPVPYPFRSGAEMLAYGIPIWKLMLENEKAWHSEAEIRVYATGIWQAMRDCMNRGLVTEGILPGGLNVRRRAPQLARKLRERGSKDPLAVMDWVNVFAMAVNEENAAGGRVVTAPTNGASGLIPAVIEYYLRYQGIAAEANVATEGIFRFLLTAAAIGVLYKENASISGAEVGCQGEVGVACSMAAAGLVAALRGDNDQVEHAAEIGMEHNLGMTCDPIGGLVQIPCIERNAIGAVKAINACRMAMQETEGHKVHLDQVIRTMYETGLDMQSRYKETSLAGLAVNAVEC
jgi:L-serine dehydratase